MPSESYQIRGSKFRGGKLLASSYLWTLRVQVLRTDMLLRTVHVPCLPRICLVLGFFDR